MSHVAAFCLQEVQPPIKQGYEPTSYSFDRPRDFLESPLLDSHLLELSQPRGVYKWLELDVESFLRVVVLTPITSYYVGSPQFCEMYAFWICTLLFQHAWFQIWVWPKNGRSC